MHFSEIIKLRKDHFGKKSHTMAILIDHAEAEMGIAEVTTNNKSN